MKLITKLLILTLLTLVLFSCNNTRTSIFEGEFESESKYAIIIVKKKTFGGFKMTFRNGPKWKELLEEQGLKQSNFFIRSGFSTCTIKNDTLYYFEAPYITAIIDKQNKFTIIKASYSCYIESYNRVK